MDISVFFLLLGIAILGLILVVLGVRAHRTPVLTGNEGMVGLTGIVTERKGFRDRFVVEVRGELWWCRSGRPLQPGMEVRIVGVDDLLLEVEPTGTSTPF